MGLSTPFSSSWANMLPKVLSDAAMYNLILLLLQGGTKIGGLVRYPLILSKASCCSCPHSNPSLFSQSKGEKA